MTGRDCEKRVPFLTKIIDNLFRRSELMGLVEDVVSGVTMLTDTLSAVDSKLDEVKTFIEGLQSGAGATPEQLQQILDLVNTAKTKAEDVLTETDALDAV